MSLSSRRKFQCGVASDMRSCGIISFLSLHQDSEAVQLLRTDMGAVCKPFKAVSFCKERGALNLNFSEDFSNFVLQVKNLKQHHIL